MAKFVLTLEDKPNGKVSIDSTPSIPELLQKLDAHGSDALTAAEAYAFTAMNALHGASGRLGKKEDEPLIIGVPRKGL